MIKDELTREINNCTSWHVVCHDGNMIRIIAENGDTFMEFPDDVEYLENMSVNWEALKTAKNRSLDNAYALLNLINDYVNTPIERRNWAGAHQANLELNMKSIKDNINKVNQIAATIGRGMSDSPASKLPQHGVIITLDDGQELHGERQYSTFMSSDFQNKAIDFGNFIIPTAIIRSIQKCGDGNDD